MPNADDWTIESWKREPRVQRLEFNEFSEPVQDTAPPLWKDLTVASAIAILLWAAAVVVFG